MLASARRAAHHNALDRTTRAATRAEYHWRRFHIDDTGHGDWEGPNSDREPRTIRVRFSCVPESMVDALHGLRAVERQFGRIRDYRLLRDSEIRSEYQAICWAAFESPRSLLRVPPQGTTLKVILPLPQNRPVGGLGLDDLKGILAPEDRRKSGPSSSQDETRFVMLNVKRADSPITFRSTVKPPFRSRAMKAAIGHAFLEWGGFATLEPLHGSSPYSSPAADLPSLDSINMRLAINKWSQILGIADPLFPEMKPTVGETRSRQKIAEGDWEPLSEPLWTADAAERIEMSPGAQRSLRQSLESLLQRSPATASADDERDERVS